MKLHIITIGEPKKKYAREGWAEFWPRLGHFHDVHATHIPDRHNDATHLLAATGNSYKVALVTRGHQFSSPELAQFLRQRELEAREVSLLVGGPEGLPAEITSKADFLWSLGGLTLPHDLAMIVLLEALYRASNINAGHPYHRA